ncbi:hypothetical protein G6F57_006794 [Rhizopus arrhizus]|nr:hypothetical protein G6F24_003339 [Rhizopus arrhizus]KAG1394930.1 hypothetical protein G6F58_012038 [Rhizopus delemar]KAG0789267.1 hypothetical protein G6F21_006634 [Rhizopus arrhizus]KAG0799452.1 hypothetical protein G6F22_003211 [Rhizopus arrhizus]KAG0805774.1 hypothetical protein G6F20_011640 [Rhizopus arrhizus]
MLRALEVDPIDRGNIEEEIRTTITNIQADKSKPTSLRYLVSSIACGDIASDSVTNYWKTKELQRLSQQNAVTQTRDALLQIREPYKLRFAKSVEQQEDSLDIYEIDGITLKGCTKSVASVIKANAIKTAMILV